MGACYASFAAVAENRSVVVRLQDAGYRTGFIGKYLNGYELAAPAPVPPGWDDWFGLTGDYLDGYSYAANDNGTREMFGTSETDYQTDVLAREAVSFVRSAAPRRRTAKETRTQHRSSCSSRRWRRTAASNLQHATRDTVRGSVAAPSRQLRRGGRV